MMWYGRIDCFLKDEAADKLIVGYRTEAWIKSFREDLKRWDFPVLLALGYPEGKYREVWIVKDKKRINK